MATFLISSSHSDTLSRFSLHIRITVGPLTSKFTLPLDVTIAQRDGTTGLVLNELVVPKIQKLRGLVEACEHAEIDIGALFTLQYDLLTIKSKWCDDMEITLIGKTTILSLLDNLLLHLDSLPK